MQLVDLKNPPIDVNEALYGPSGIVGSGNTLGGVLGAALGESAEQKQARVEEAKKAAKDLTGLVRKKQKAEPQPTADSATTAAPAASGLNGNGKRRAEEEPTEAAPEESKKARVEDAAE